MSDQNNTDWHQCDHTCTHETERFYRAINDTVDDAVKLVAIAAYGWILLVLWGSADPPDAKDNGWFWLAAIAWLALGIWKVTPRRLRTRVHAGARAFADAARIEQNPKPRTTPQKVARGDYAEFMNKAKREAQE